MRDRLATESVEEREARLQQMSTRQSEQRLATESAEERGQATADEGQTGLCVRCCQDKHIPKMCSSADPGPLPLQLQVGTYTCMYKCQPAAGVVRGQGPYC